MYPNPSNDENINGSIESNSDIRIVNLDEQGELHNILAQLFGPSEGGPSTNQEAMVLKAMDNFVEMIAMSCQLYREMLLSAQGNSTTLEYGDTITNMLAIHPQMELIGSVLVALFSAAGVTDEQLEYAVDEALNEYINKDDSE